MTSPESIVLPFAKMQALGNDFVVIDAESLLASPATQTLLENWKEFLPTLAQRLSSRRIGVGADGLILAIDLMKRPLKNATARIYDASSDDCQLAWTYTNSDGTTPETCGNGLRCLALWAHRKGLLKGRTKVLTKAGPVEIAFNSEDQIEVDLGAPYLSAGEIPFAGMDAHQQVIAHAFDIGNDKLAITCISMGNPHCIIFSGALKGNSHIELPFDNENKLHELPAPLTALAESIQADSRFPQGVNVSFIVSHKSDNAQAVVYERGCGPTLACGSAAAAILVAGVLEGRLERQSTITLPGGTLSVEWSGKDNHVRITGPARLVFEGQISLPLSQLNLPNISALSGAIAK